MRQRGIFSVHFWYGSFSLLQQATEKRASTREMKTRYIKDILCLQSIHRLLLPVFPKKCCMMFFYFKRSKPSLIFSLYLVSLQHTVSTAGASSQLYQGPTVIRSLIAFLDLHAHVNLMICWTSTLIVLASQLKIPHALYKWSITDFRDLDIHSEQHTTISIDERLGKITETMRLLYYHLMQIHLSLATQTCKLVYCYCFHS